MKPLEFWSADCCVSSGVQHTQRTENEQTDFGSVHANVTYKTAFLPTHFESIREEVPNKGCLVVSVSESALTEASRSVIFYHKKLVCWDTCTLAILKGVSGETRISVPELCYSPHTVFTYCCYKLRKWFENFQCFWKVCRYNICTTYKLTMNLIWYMTLNPKQITLNLRVNKYIPSHNSQGEEMKPELQHPENKNRKISLFTNHTAQTLWISTTFLVARHCLTPCPASKLRDTLQSRSYQSSCVIGRCLQLLNQTMIIPESPAGKCSLSTLREGLGRMQTSSCSSFVLT